ncbi:hypothetical protein [Cohnella pontilimi]|nr:hypothetical protein [Cohnella pontilimi]
MGILTSVLPVVNLPIFLLVLRSAANLALSELASMRALILAAGKALVLT